MADVSKFSPDGGTTIYDIRDPKTMSAAESLTRDTTGWTGKNKIVYPFGDGDSWTANGITITVNKNSKGEVVSVEADGTATVDTFYNIRRKEATTEKLPQGTYYISGCPSGGGESKYMVYVHERNADNTEWMSAFRDFGNGALYTRNNDNQYAVIIKITSGVTVNHLLFYPQIQDANNTDHTYEPYHPTVAEELSSRISTFNGRSGSVLPMAGDYDATQVNYSSQQTMKQKIDAVAGVWTSAVSCLVGDTTATITNAAITANSIIDAVVTETASGNVIAYTKIVVSSGSAVITWASALTEAVSVKIHVTNL